MKSQNFFFLLSNFLESDIDYRMSRYSQPLKNNDRVMYLYKFQIPAFPEIKSHYKTTRQRRTRDKESYLYTKSDIK